MLRPYSRDSDMTEIITVAFALVGLMLLAGWVLVLVASYRVTRTPWRVSAHGEQTVHPWSWSATRYPEALRIMASQRRFTDRR